MRIPLPIQTGHKAYDPDEFEECQGKCSDCAWCKLEKNDKGEVWVICTSPDGSFEWREEE